MFGEDVYMIRAGAFGTDYNTKLIMCLVALGMAIYDRYKHKRWDLLVILAFGTVIWSGAEFLLQRADVRELTQPQLFGMTLPGWSHIPFQGCSEGGAMAVYGLFFGDRLLRPETRKKTVIALSVLMALILFKGIMIAHFKPGTNEISSVREMFAPINALYVWANVLICGVFLWWARANVRRRALGMFGVLCVICAVFTGSQFIEGGRWITIGKEDLYSMPPLPAELGLVAYDVFAEFGAVVLAFYAVLIVTGGIHKHREDVDRGAATGPSPEAQAA